MQGLCQVKSFGYAPYPQHFHCQDEGHRLTETHHSGEVAEIQTSLELDRKLKGGTYVEWKGGTVGSAQSYVKMVTEFETKIKS